ncbi:MAG: bifunctional oligoribonuclease/PAP phosphatase NrnA, partial [Lachnospiraceae bacterium]
RMTEMFGVEIFNSEEYKDFDENKFVITVDGQKNNSNFSDLPGDEVACIDHHDWTTNYQYQFVDHRLVGACSTIVTDYYMESGINPSADVATALLYGIKMDTFNFSRGVKEEDIKAFAYLHPKADIQRIRTLENSTVELSDLRAYGVAFQNTVVYDRMGFAHINFDCPDSLIAMVSDFILSLSSVDISVIYADRDGGYKFSVRSEIEGIHSGQLISMALNGIGNGGGHPTMAGGIILKENALKLGNDHDFMIRKRFLDVEMVLREQLMRQKLAEGID